jgi:hypothetical protein
MSKYDSLKGVLLRTNGTGVTLTFTEIERALGFRLPISARKYRPWWANQSDGAHVQAQAWMGAGWRVWSVDLASETVRFDRRHEDRPTGLESPASPAFERDTLSLPRRALSLGALRLIEIEQAESGRTEAEAAVELFNRMAVERKKRLLKRFPLTGERSPVDSVDLIREDRDAR